MDYHIHVLLDLNTQEAIIICPCSMNLYPDGSITLHSENCLSIFTFPNWAHLKVDNTPMTGPDVIVNPGTTKILTNNNDTTEDQPGEFTVICDGIVAQHELGCTPVIIIKKKKITLPKYSSYLNTEVVMDEEEIKGLTEPFKKGFKTSKEKGIRYRISIQREEPKETK